MNQTSAVRPSLWYCLLGVPFLLAGGGFYVYTLSHGLVHVTDSLTQVVVPGKAQLNFKRGVTYTVFLEENTVVRGKVYSANGSISGLECTVRSVANGDPVRMPHPDMSTTYDLGGRSGYSVLEFTIPESGSYEFACGYGEGVHGPEVAMAVGSGVGTRIIMVVLECLRRVSIALRHSHTEVTEFCSLRVC